MQRIARPVEQNYTVPEAAALLNVSVATIWRWIRRHKESRGAEGLGPVRELGPRMTRIPASTLNQFQEARTA